MESYTDQKYLLAEQYPDSKNLASRRQLHEKFSTNNFNWHSWVFDRLCLQPGEAILEVGCGPAPLWLENSERVPAECSITLIDLSRGMVEEARQSTREIKAIFQYEVADVQALPFKPESFDLVVANHMLYHLPDLKQGLSEIQRVLKPGGRLCAATNGARHMAELYEITRRFVSALLEEMDQSDLGFRLESGRADLAPYFKEIKLLQNPSNLQVTDPEALLAYILSGKVKKRLEEQKASSGVDPVPQILAYLKQEIEAKGHITITRETGLFTAVK